MPAYRYFIIDDFGLVSGTADQDDVEDCISNGAVVVDTLTQTYWNHAEEAWLPVESLNSLEDEE